MRLLLPVIALVFCSSLPLSSSARADDPLSGPKVGEKAAGFEVELAVGSKAGETLDYLSTLKDKPVLLVFVGEMSRPGFGLLKVVDKYAQLRQPEGLEILIVRVTDDRPGAVKYAKLLNEKYDLKAVAGVSTEGKAGPKSYTLSDECEMTILLLDKEHKVLHNIARRAPEKQDFKPLREAIDKLLGPPPVAFP